ncbi:MAG: DUF2059 domain-containing protein [Caulobacteraceae bacterium]
MAAAEIQQEMTLKMARRLDNASSKFATLFPDNSPAAIDAYQQAMSSALDDARPRALEAVARACAANFTPAELKQIIAFYRSPAGRALATKRQTVLTPTMEDSFEQLQPAIMADFHARFCAITKACDAEPASSR